MISFQFRSPVVSASAKSPPESRAGTNSEPIPVSRMHRDRVNCDFDALRRTVNRRETSSRYNSYLFAPIAPARRSSATVP